MQNLPDWHSGWAEYKAAHPNMSTEEYTEQLNKHDDNFDVQKFLDHYDNLSNKEWQAVIDDMMKIGYDIRSVLCYKHDFVNDDIARLRGKKFTIEPYEEIVKPLMKVDGCIEFAGYNSPLQFDDYEAEQERKSIIQNYQEFGLPIPKYWKELLW